MWYPFLIIGAVAAIVFVPSRYTAEYLPASSMDILASTRIVVERSARSLYDTARSKALALLRDQLHNAIDESVK